MKDGSGAAGATGADGAAATTAVGSAVSDPALAQDLHVFLHSLFSALGNSVNATA
jgi:hypothetical protein